MGFLSSPSPNLGFLGISSLNFGFLGSPIWDLGLLGTLSWDLGYLGTLSWDIEIQLLQVRNTKRITHYIISVLWVKFFYLVLLIKVCVQSSAVDFSDCHGF